MKRILVLVVIGLLSKLIYSQTTLWKNHNPYGDALQVGQLIRIKIKESFSFNINSTWQNNSSLDMKLHPDRNNIAMLKDSEQSRNNKRNNSVIYKGNDKLNFVLTGSIKEKINDFGVYSIEAQRNINIDGKPIQVQLKGLFMASDIQDNAINSIKIANLELSIISKPDIIKDDKLALKPIDADNDQPKQVLTEQAQREFLLKHVQEIMGYFK